HHIEHHRVVVFLDQRRDLRLQLEGARAAQEVVHLARAVLKRELDVIEAGGLERPDARFGQADAGGDEIDIETQLARLRDDELQVIARKRLAAGQTELNGSERACLAQHANPVRGLELRSNACEIGRVVAKHAVQRTAISQLQQEPQRRTGSDLGRRNRTCFTPHRAMRQRAHSRISSQFFSRAMFTNAVTSADRPWTPNAVSRSATISSTVRWPSQRLMIAPALPFSLTMPSGYKSTCAPCAGSHCSLKPRPTMGLQVVALIGSLRTAMPWRHSSATARRA